MVDRDQTRELWFAALRERAACEPLNVDISDYSDEWCAGFLAGQVNLLDLIDDALAPVRRVVERHGRVWAKDTDYYDAAEVLDIQEPPA